MAGYELERSATVDDMLDNLKVTPGALPLLQFAVSKLWELRDPERHLLTHRSYEEMGGVAGALASHADRVLTEIGAQRMPLVRAILLRLVTAERTRAIVPLAELRELSREVGEVQRSIDQLVDARLLVVQTLEGAQGTTVEIVHESLVHGWPTLRRWLDENQDDVALVDQLRTAARQWASKRRDPGLLWRGETAAEAKRFRLRYQGPRSDVERELLESVDRQEQAAQRRRRALAIGGITLLSLVVIAAVSLAVVFQSASAREQQQNAEINKQKLYAEEQLQLATEREHARLKAEAAKQILDEKLGVADQQLRERARELASANIQLEVALHQSQQNEAEATQAKRRAERTAAEAQHVAKVAEAARDQAVRQREEVEELRALERAENARAPGPDKLRTPSQAAPSDSIPKPGP